MNWNKPLITLGLGVFWGISMLGAQDTLSLMQVVSRTLESNYQIQVSQLENQQAQNTATRGQAGFFPQINANGSGAFSQNNTKLEFAGGLPDVARNGAINTSYGANIGLNYTVFNGFGRVYTYRGLVQQYRMTQLQAKLLAENLVFEAVNRFVNYQQFRLNAEIAAANLRVSEERLKYTLEAVKNGVGTKLEALSAELDFKNDSLMWVQSQGATIKESYALNVLMGTAPNFPVYFNSQMPVPVLESQSVLVEKVGKNASSVLLAQVSKELSQTQMNLAQSRQMPSLNIAANYGLLNSQNGAGIILSQSNLGFNSSANLTVPIFNGKQLQTAIKNADLDVKQRNLEYEQAKLQAVQLVYEAFTDQGVLEVQINTLTQSVEVAERALLRAIESHRNGQIRYTDLRTAQVNKLQAESALVSARMNLLRLRYSVKRLSGELLE